jgi:hypothetical protein
MLSNRGRAVAGCTNVRLATLGRTPRAGSSNTVAENDLIFAHPSLRGWPHDLTGAATARTERLHRPLVRTMELWCYPLFTEGSLIRLETPVLSSERSISQKRPGRTCMETRRRDARKVRERRCGPDRRWKLKKLLRDGTQRAQGAQGKGVSLTPLMDGRIRRIEV